MTLPFVTSAILKLCLYYAEEVGTTLSQSSKDSGDGSSNFKKDSLKLSVFLFITAEAKYGMEEDSPKFY